MAIRVALQHRTTYRFDRNVGLGPHEIRLRPAPHCRTPILSYSLKITPEDHFINWQQDPYSNYLARLVINKPTRKFKVDTLGPRITVTAWPPSVTRSPRACTCTTPPREEAW